MECLALWKEASENYLYVRLLDVDDDETYRCLKYQHHGNDVTLSMSVDATCRGLKSAVDGPFLMKFVKADLSLNKSNRCHFPNWIKNTTWRDMAGRFKILANESENSLVERHRRPSQPKDDVHAVHKCRSILSNFTNEANERILIYHVLTIHNCVSRSTCLQIRTTSYNIMTVSQGYIYGGNDEEDDEDDNDQVNVNEVNRKSTTSGKVSCPLPGNHHTAPVGTCMYRLNVGCNQESTILIEPSCSTDRRDDNLECLATWSNKLTVSHYVMVRHNRTGVISCYSFRRENNIEMFGYDPNCIYNKINNNNNRDGSINNNAHHNTIYQINKQTTNNNNKLSVHRPHQQSNNHSRRKFPTNNSQLNQQQNLISTRRFDTVVTTTTTSHKHLLDVSSSFEDTNIKKNFVIPGGNDDDDYDDDDEYNDKDDEYDDDDDNDDEDSGMTPGGKKRGTDHSNNKPNRNKHLNTNSNNNKHSTKYTNNHRFDTHQEDPLNPDLWQNPKKGVLRSYNPTVTTTPTTTTTQLHLWRRVTNMHQQPHHQKPTSIYKHFNKVAQQTNKHGRVAIIDGNTLKHSSALSSSSSSSSMSLSWWLHFIVVHLAISLTSPSYLFDIIISNITKFSTFMSTEEQKKRFKYHISKKVLLKILCKIWKPLFIERLHARQQYDNSLLADTKVSSRNHKFNQFGSFNGSNRNTTHATTDNRRDNNNIDLQYCHKYESNINAIVNESVNRIDIVNVKNENNSLNSRKITADIDNSETTHTHISNQQLLPTYHLYCQLNPTVKNPSDTSHTAHVQLSKHLLSDELSPLGLNVS
ncbi:hypothetical protein HELRODRAFT_160645 [Helobdella robusta]|uniref:DUF7042 domain-containing protein n=1 Tax=Helobdella robusta TaxID=6412 RepID=T1EQJ8_HELRO|nr:hypothetical protein HELRODRAFT_160645 [Helobdella robusta]ESO06474.1 hypothetical protein HELRODRAFT_160645 [Helobdella robusta]